MCVRVCARVHVCVFNPHGSGVDAWTDRNKRPMTRPPVKEVAQHIITPPSLGRQVGTEHSVGAKQKQPT
jgi:hypothetical protein